MNVFADFHESDDKFFKNVSTLISERCLATTSPHEFFKVVWSNEKYEGELRKNNFLKSPCLSDSDKIHLAIYHQRDNAQIIISEELAKPFETMVSLKNIPRDLFQLLITYEQKITFTNNPGLMSFWKGEFLELINYYQKILNPPFITNQELNELYHQTPNRRVILDGKYEETVRLFLFCRKDRNFPCLFTAKDKFDNPLVSIDGDKIWSQPALAQSARGLTSNIVNGRTPQGVHTIDSVMPYADQYRSFGKYRRIILNWVPTNDESEMNEDRITKSLLSPLSENTFWWRQASVSRDLGRTDLRIHGTGKINEDPSSTYYPLRKSNGCITQREGEYPEDTYHDQRHMLNQMMSALDLPLSYENEERISGTLYVIELDNQKAPVLWPEIESRLGFARENDSI